MTSAEKIMLKKALKILNSSLSWNGGTTDWAGYANQMKSYIKSSVQLIETILELPENDETTQPQSKTTPQDLDNLLP
jgi:hypothetical protein